MKFYRCTQTYSTYIEYSDGKHISHHFEKNQLITAVEARKLDMAYTVTASPYWSQAEVPKNKTHWWNGRRFPRIKID